VASQNRGKLLVFAPKKQSAVVLAVAQDVMAVELVLASGKKQRIDLSLGAGFASQSSRVIHLPKGLKSATAISYGGKKSPLTLPLAK
jgi:microcystin degradation protein MlrC